MDGLQLTVEKIRLSTSNVKELLDKLAKKESKEGELGNEADEDCQQATDVASLGARAVSNVRDAAGGVAQLGQATVSHAANLAKRATQTPKKEVKEAKVCIKTVHVKTITVHTVGAMVSDNQSPSLSLKGPPVYFKDFSRTHGVSGAASAIQAADPK